MAQITERELGRALSTFPIRVAAGLQTTASETRTKEVFQTATLAPIGRRTAGYFRNESSAYYSCEFFLWVVERLDCRGQCRVPIEAFTTPENR